MKSSNLSGPQANFQIVLWNKEAEHVSSDELYVRLQKLGLPEEVVSRLHDLSSEAQQVGEQMIRIGKIVLLKIIEFVEKHFFLVAGVSVGAMVGAAVASLIVSIPLLGPLLAPLANLLNVTAIGAGAMLGNELDKVLPSVGKSLMDIAREFFKLFVDVLNAIFSASEPSFSAS